ncbi:MAG: DNA-directed RNA polymerase subunit alpha [Dehalococcoidales bacterium]|nr:DNA-directed RNA polymerase subunit alpha [Dehalococcoidales bacterium]
MSSLVVPTIECIECKENFGRFRAEPLEKGVGVTMGNSLRRVLLGYLPGAAVTRVKIDGIEHEFTVITNAKEDVMDFLLNIKALRLKPISGRPGKLTLEIQGEGQITAANIKPSADFEVTNPDLYLITLNSADAKLYVEMDVEMGIGFRQAESSDNMPVGTIPVDAIFTPTRKVNFSIEPIHAGRETSRERLFLDVWTDGTVSPTDAVSQGAAILIEQLTPFVDYAKVSQMKAEERLIRLAIPDEKFNMPVEQLDLSVRTMNCLRRSGITTVGEIIAKGPKELMKLRNFGQKSFQEINGRMASIGLSFAQTEGESEGPVEEGKETGEGTESDLTAAGTSQEEEQPAG